MNRPSIGAYASVFEAIRRYRPHQDSLHDVLKNFVDGIDDKEASVLPKSVVDIMPLLKPDINRLRFAADLLARLDLYESTGALFTVAVQTRDRRLMLAAASLAGNPAVDSSLRDRIKTYAGDDRMVMIRLSPDVVPSTQHEKMLYLQCWPGERTADMPLQFAPVVVLDVSLPPANSLKLAAMLEGAGAAVRRLDTSAPLPHWFGYQTALVCKPKNADTVRSKYPQLAPDRVFTEALPSQSGKLIQRMVGIYSSIPRVKQREYKRVLDEVSTYVWSTANYSLGVYGTTEIRYLTGTSLYLLKKLVKNGYLKPRIYKQSKYYRFADIVAVRSFVHLKNLSPKRVPVGIVPKLAEFPGNDQAINIGVTSQGNVLFDKGEGWVDANTGQSIFGLDITSLDNVFEPFKLGGGHMPEFEVPGLLNVSSNTCLHPSVMNGLPYLRNHRIKATTLAAMEERGGIENIYASYPELKDTALEDAIEVGKKLMYM